MFKCNKRALVPSPNALCGLAGLRSRAIQRGDKDHESSAVSDHSILEGSSL